jgi:very-short-patch-repair endonuclease
MLADARDPSPFRRKAAPSLSRKGRGVRNGDAAKNTPSPLAGEGARLSEPLGEPSRSGTGGSPTHQELLARAKYMRSNPTEAERRLWTMLRNKRFAAFKFKRQVVIDWYIADFVNFDQRVIVEADGSQHAESAYDDRRDAHLRAQGFEVLRFWNNDILKNAEGIPEAIWAALQNPSPLAGEGGSREAAEGRGGTERCAASVEPCLACNHSAPAPSPSLASLTFPSPSRGEGF